MAAFGLSLDSPLLPNVDSFINPTKGEDEHRSALNAVVLNIHRAGAGAFEGLVTNQLGEYLSNPDSKVRERATLLLAELLARLPTLPLAAASAARFAGFFSSRLGDYPSVVPSLKALSGLLKNHSPALFGGEDAAAAAAAAGGGASSRRSVPAPAVAAGAALSVLLALVTHPGSTEALSSGMGKTFVDGLVGSLEGEKDPRCLIVGLSALRKTQQGFDPAVLQETSEAVFDATACYFPVTFTPPPNDPHNISPDALRTGLEGVLVGSPGMAPHVLPMLLDKLSSEVSTAKEASLKAMVAGVRAFGAPGVGGHLRAIGGAMSEEAVHGSDPDLAALALLSLTEVVRETASHAVFTGLGEACPEWRALAKPLLEGAVAEVTGDQPCSVLGRGSARVLLALAASSALGLRSALALAVPRLLRARKEAAAAAAAMKRDVSALEGGSTSGCCGGGGGAEAGGGGCCGGGGGGHEDATVTSGGGAAVADAEAFEDAQTARLGALAGLAAAVDDKVDFSGSQGGAPLQPYVDPLLSEFSAALTGHSGGGGEASSLPPQAAPAAARPPSAAAAATVSLASRGLSDVITRPPASLVEEGKIQDVVRSLVAVLASPGAWEGGGGGGEQEGGSGVGEGTAALAVLTALRSIGLRRPEYARAVLDTAVPPLLKQLPRARPPPPAGENDESTCPPGGDGGGTSDPPSSPAGTAAAAAAAAAEGERACAALVELSEVPGVFAIALSVLLAACTSTADRGSAAAERPLLRCTPGAEIALRALEDTLKRGARRGHHGDEILAFVRGVAPPPLPWPSCPPPATAAPPPAAADGAAVPSAPPTTAKEERQSEDSGGGGSDGLWGLPLLLAALDASLSGPEEGGTSSSAETAGVAGGSGGGDRSAGAGTSALSNGALVSNGAMAAVVSTARTCTQAAPAGDQEALLSSLLCTLLPPPSPASAAGGGGGGSGGGGGGAVVGAIEKHSALLPVLASVMGAVRLDSKALRGPGGAAAAAVPSLLSGALAEGAAGLIEEPLAAGGGGGGGGGAASARRAPCCQCLAAVLNKLAGGAEVDSAVALVVTALTEAFSDEGEGAMDVDGAAAAPEEGPVQCLAWTLKAVAMRGGIGDAFSDLLGLLCGLLTAGPSRAGDETPSRRALAAAAAFGVALRDDGEVLRADADGGGGGGGGGARVSPLWRQRFFVQTFPKLLAAARGPARTRTGGDEDNDSSCDEDMAEQQATATDATTAGGSGSGGGSAGLRVPALLALMRVVRGVPLEALSQQQQQRDTAVSAVVQALRSDYQPLQAEALETFQVLSRDDLTAFNQHLSSVIPLLLSLAEARNGSRTRSTGGPVNHSDAEGPGADGSLRRGRSGPMERFRAVRCLTALTALPYSRLHPFKTQVTRRLRGPLDDDRRAIRQAAAEARNIWFLLG